MGAELPSLLPQEHARELVVRAILFVLFAQEREGKRWAKSQAGDEHAAHWRRRVQKEHGQTS